MAQVVSSGNDSDDVLPMEFVNLPMHQELTLDAPQHDNSMVLTMVSQSEHASSVFDAKAQLKQTLHRWQGVPQNRVKPFRTDDRDDRDARRRLKNRLAACSAVPNSKDTDLPSVDVACFASHGSLGIVDLGATKTVIGSKLVPELLNGLDPNKKIGFKMSLQRHVSFWKSWYFAEPTGHCGAYPWTFAQDCRGAWSHSVSPIKHLAESIGSHN